MLDLVSFYEVHVRGAAVYVYIGMHAAVRISQLVVSSLGC